jgi:hypothetical protein
MLQGPRSVSFDRFSTDPVRRNLSAPVPDSAAALDFCEPEHRVGLPTCQ